MATLAEWQAQQVKDNAVDVSQASEDFNFGSEDSGWLASMAAGVPSGIFKIFEGAATLGATLLDLGVDKDRADSVEAFFDKINPFDEAASATAAGKITELIINLGVPGAPAFKIGSGLAKATLKAKEAGTYLSFGEKARRLGQGALATGATDAIFVGDVEATGSFGDFMGGPTQLDRDSDTPVSEILNRLKFGIEGSAFAGAIGGVGYGISAIRNSKGFAKAPEGTGMNLAMDKFLRTVSGGVTSKGFKNINQFLIDNARRGNVDADLNRIATFRDTIDDNVIAVAEKYSKTIGNKISSPKLQKELLEEMQEVMVSGGGKDGKMVPLFNAVDEIGEDALTGRQFKTGSGLLEKYKPGSPLPDKVVKWDKKKGQRVLDSAGKEVMESTKVIDPTTGRPKKMVRVDIDGVNSKKREAFIAKLKKYDATPKQERELFDTIIDGREMFGEMFTSIGRRLTPDSFEKFKDVLKVSLNDVVDRGYSVFRNNAGQTTVAKNYPPTNDIIKKTVNYYKRVARQKGYNVAAPGKKPEPGQLGDEVFEKLVDQTWRTATMDKGFITASQVKPGTVKLGSVPEFFTNSVRSNLDNASKKFIGTDVSNLAEITKVDKLVIQRLLGKNKNPMSTLVDGVSNLSAQVRSGQAFDEMVVKNNILKTAWSRWDKGFKTIDPKTKKEIQVAPRTGPEPESPFLFENQGEAQKFLGGVASDFKEIAPGAADSSRVIDRFIDTNLPLKGVDDIEKARLANLTEAGQRISNPIAGKWALKEVAETFMKSEEASKSLAAQIYNNLVLYPKGTSQMAKTVLAPFTHARNFLSATSFAAANGHLPFGNIDDVKKAWNSLQAPGPFGFKKSNEFYQELLRLGVVNSSVRLRQVQDLLQDAKFGAILNNVNSDWALNKLMRRFNKIKKGAEDAYTAEDDFWKIFTFLGEKTKISNAYKNSGLRLGQEFTDINGVKRLFNDRTMNELSADLVRNTVPNYSYVSEFIKGLRKLPLGNFIAFPAEILRTGVNIVDTALREINYSTMINGQIVKPLVGRGRQRLMGMAITTAAIPLGITAATKTIYDITEDEVNAMKRYVADWSKNSVLIPFRKEDGTLQYIDFSHLNAYDTLTRPIQTVLNKVEAGKADEDGIMDDFILGLIESTKELGAPFISESIWTEALQDVAPILGRNGTDSEGRRIWNPQDSRGDKLSKALSHLVEAQLPLNWRQLERLGLSMFPADSEGRFSERGDEYTFGNEALGILGMRRVDVNPKKSFNYKVSDYKKGVRNSRGLFTSATLKGGVVSPENLIDAYINANRSLYKVNRELYQDIQAAQVLGMSEDSLSEGMIKRGERKAFNSLIEGEFRPLKISKDVQDIFEIRASELGVANPYERAESVIDSISDQLSSASLRGDLFPDITNPFDIAIIPNLVDQVSEMVTSTATTTAPGFVGQGNVGIPTTNVPYERLNTDQKINKANNLDNFIKP